MWDKDQTVMFGDRRVVMETFLFEFIKRISWFTMQMQTN